MGNVSRLENEKDACHERWMAAALEDAEAALAAGEFPVGCVLVAGDHIVARGRRHGSRPSTTSLTELDHAEVIALRNLAAAGGHTDMAKVTAYCTLEPCLMCFATLVLNGVRSIVYGYEDVMGGGTSLDLATLPPLYAGMEVRITGGVRREESLILLYRFFRNQGEKGYLQDTLLARHTLAAGATLA